MRKIIYENNKPSFAILHDKYQWILARAKRIREDGSFEWQECTYHPNLCNLLDELAENQFKNNTKKLKELKDIEKSVLKVYNLIEKVWESLGSALEDPSV